MQYRKSFGLILRELRELAGLSADDLGDKLGCGSNQVLRWESNQAKFYPTSLKPYAHILKIDPHILLAEYLNAEAAQICARAGIEFLFKIIPTTQLETLWETQAHDEAG